jgi:hypothetical protein
MFKLNSSNKSTELKLNLYEFSSMSMLRRHWHLDNIKSLKIGPFVVLRRLVIVIRRRLSFLPDWYIWRNRFPTHKTPNPYHQSSDISPSVLVLSTSANCFTERDGKGGERATEESPEFSPQHHPWNLPGLLLFTPFTYICNMSVYVYAFWFVGCVMMWVFFFFFFCARELYM